MSVTKCYDLDCSVTITYTNTRNFDDFVYELSPHPTNQIVIPGQFWKEDEPMEQSDIELSDGEIVVLRQSIKTKRYLEIGFLPRYMHEKLRRILMHDTVTIEGVQWRKLDQYESDNLNKYGLKKASVWLTLYNSVEKNSL